MKRVGRLWVAGLAVAALGLGLTLDINLGSSTLAVVGPEPSDPLSEIRGEKVKKLYEQWAQAQEAAGGDSNLVVGLGRSRTHAAIPGRMVGTSRIDMKTGRVTAEVHGLPEGQEFDLWLVDNRSSDEGSSLPDDEDELIRVGTLVRSDGLSRLEAQLDLGAFDRFQIDVVAVAAAGQSPSDSVLFGSLSLFQRLYSALGSESRLLASDFSRGARRGAPAAADDGLLSVRSAHAAPIYVDADVIFNNLVRTGAELFINQTFEGNGRTCATCHPALNNVTLDVPFISNLPDDDPLFVAEFVPGLAQNFENPVLMRGAALILENLDGFGDLPNRFVMRSVPHTLALATSLAPTSFPFDNTIPDNSNFPPGYPAQRTGWGGDGSPNSGSLRDFAVGAVTQHFTLTMARQAGADFRLPTVAELDAMEAFQLSLGRQADPNVTALRFRDPRVRLGRDIFNRLDTGNPPKPSVGPAPNPFPQGPPLPAGKCALCHQNAGATINVQAFTELFNNLGVPVPSVSGNANFATGVNDLAASPASILDPTRNPRDGGFGLIPHDGVTPLPQIGDVPCQNGRGGFGVVTLPGGVLPPGLCEEDFNTPPLVEAADTPPFFHNNAVNTIEAAVAFYNDDALNNSVGGQLLRLLDTNGVGINLDTTQVTAIASFLRVLNALENIRQARETLLGAIQGLPVLSSSQLNSLLDNALAEVDDALKVLEDGHLHPAAVKRLRSASSALRRFDRILFFITVPSTLNQAKNDLVDP